MNRFQALKNAALNAMQADSTIDSHVGGVDPIVFVPSVNTTVQVGQTQQSIAQSATWLL